MWYVLERRWGPRHQACDGAECGKQQGGSEDTGVGNRRRLISSRAQVRPAEVGFLKPSFRAEGGETSLERLVGRQDSRLGQGAYSFDKYQMFTPCQVLKIYQSLKHKESSH